MCCSNCFKDDFLRDFIERNSITRADCEHCGLVDAVILPAAHLAPYFEPVLEGYTFKASGYGLVELWSEDWDFLKPGVENRLLLIDILGDAAKATYVARDVTAALSDELWERLRHELQYENRFFPGNAPDRGFFASLISNLVTVAPTDGLFRARLMTGGKLFPPEEMGAPPPQFASDGRANPIGIPYLYLADDVNTAIAEVKPSKMARVAIVSFSAPEEQPLTIVDLRNPRSTISPFKISSVAEVRASMSFLNALGRELSVPTQPHRATRDYLASQYLCELIKVCGYAGVVYRSSLASGNNYAFFDASAYAASGAVTSYQVSDVRVEAVLDAA
jgi:hypothetical protein